MKIKFLAKTITEYKGLTKGDIREVTATVGKMLLEAYPKDFDVVVIEQAAHAGKNNKQAKKTLEYRSK